MPSKKRVFIIHPKDEEEFIKAEDELRKRIEEDKRIPPKAVKRYLDLLYTKREEDPILDDMVHLFLLVIKAKTIYYFEKEEGYSFSDKKDGKEYSLLGWLESFFRELEERTIDVKDRNKFLTYTADSLQSYVSDLDKPISFFRICVITGFIGSQFNHLNTKEVYLLKKSGYQTYHDYLHKTISNIWKP